MKKRLLTLSYANLLVFSIVFAQPQVSKEVFYLWDIETEEWVNESHQSYDYDAFRNQVYHLTQKWDSEDQSWQNKWESTNFYNAVNKLNSHTYQSWDLETAEIISTSRVFYHYSGSRKTQIIKEYWNPDTQVWEEYFQRFLEYDKNGCLIKILSQVAYGTGEWTNDYFVIKEYHENCEVKTRNIRYWGEGSWRWRERQERVYSANKDTLFINTYERDLNEEAEELIETIHWVYNQKGQLIKTWHIKYGNSYESISTFRYNSNDQIIFYKDERKYNAMSDWIIEAEVDYSYNVQGLLEKKTSKGFWEPDQGNWSSIWIKDFFYDENNFLVREQWDLFRPPTDEQTITEWRYDNFCNGFRREVTKTIIEGETPGPVNRRVYTYTKDINCLEKETIPLILIPNPSRGYLHIESSIFLAGNTQITIYDAVGRQVYKDQELLSKEYTSLSLNNLPNGLYFLYLEGNGKRAVESFLLEKN